MSYCLNPFCKKPQNRDEAKTCPTCGAELFLRKRYRAIRPIGEGAFSRSFFAEDTDRLNSPCVIKQFLPLPQIQNNNSAMAKTTQMFEQEARQLLQLGEQHPQVPALYAYFEEDKRLYLITQYIEGQDLSQLLQEQGAYNEQQIRELLHDILPVLQFVHNRQAIHRDIKLRNIIKRKSDRKHILIDFGISRQLTDNKFTPIRFNLATEGYAPLEQLRGGRIYPASDLYSLGIVCIQLLTQAALDELYNPIEGGWVWRDYLRRLGADISDQLYQVLDKLLKDSLKKRYQSATEVLKELYTEGWRKTVLPPNSIPTIPIRNWRCVSNLVQHTDTVTCLTFSPNALMLVSGSADKSIKLWKAGNGRLISTINGHSDTVACLATSPDGRILASGSADCTIKLWQLGNGNLIRTFTGHSVTIFSLAFTPDGEVLVSGSGDGNIKLWQVNSGKLINTLTGHSDFVESIVITPDSKTLASGSWDNTIKIWDLQSGRLVNTLTGHGGSIWAIALSPDGELLASISGDNTIKLWQLSNGKLINTLTSSSGSVWSIAYSPNGETIACDSGDNTIKIWQVEQGKLLRTLSGHSAQVRTLAFSPDGKILASGSDDRTIKLWRHE